MKAISLVIATLFATVAVHAADKEDTNTTTEDHSKNPITGTETTTKKTHMKHKGDHGKTEAKAKTTTKMKTDGSKETTTKTEKTESKE